jgi:hypothetical protein
MEVLLSVCFENIGLAGLRGISIRELWERVEEEIATKSDMPFDMDTKNWCWNHFLGSELLDFYLSSVPNPKLSVDKEEGTLVDLNRTFIAKNSLKSFPLYQIINSYGDKLCLVAKLSVRWDAYGLKSWHISSMKTMCSHHKTVGYGAEYYQIIEALARRNHKGLNMIELVQHMANPAVDKRALHHWVSNLESLKIVIKFPVLFRDHDRGKFFATSLLFLPKFANPSNLLNDVL